MCVHQTTVCNNKYFLGQLREHEAYVHVHVVVTVIEKWNVYRG